ncbi:hypothetical protein M3201_15890 [Paenibacillus motobuensis]|uniref:hypothetical protein n=1 Tax=Paenibacillus TaxID=44249 RepID=UPI00203E4323|nr:MULTISPECIES: hypothetical protein [Paenibacillus]MCM3041187.1 hypothetical protein [Paenibacillus lutimineralis]MCM3648291.1 hypothetical protein [Paenibacillus motobuensis]
MVNQVLKWILLLCAVSFALNVLLYWGFGKPEMLINLYGSAGIGALVGIGLLFRRKRR